MLISNADPHFKLLSKLLVIIVCNKQLVITSSGIQALKTFHTNWDFIVFVIFSIVWKSRNQTMRLFFCFFDQIQYFVRKLSSLSEIAMKFETDRFKKIFNRRRAGNKHCMLFLARSNGFDFKESFFWVCLLNFYFLLIVGNDFLSHNFPLHTSIIYAFQRLKKTCHVN